MSPPADSGRPAGRSRAPLAFAAADAANALLFAALAAQIPSRHPGSAALLWSVVGAFVALGAGSAMRSAWGWRAAVIAALSLVALELVLLTLIVSSAAFLAGVYGSLGRGAAAIAIGLALLSVEVIALVPLLQLRYLWSRGGRASFGVA